MNNRSQMQRHPKGHAPRRAAHMQRVPCVEGRGRRAADTGRVIIAPAHVRPLDHLSFPLSINAGSRSLPMSGFLKSGNTQGTNQ